MYTRNCHSLEVLCKLTDCVTMLLHTTYVHIDAVECRRVAAVSTAERVAYEMGTACYSSTSTTLGTLITCVYILTYFLFYMLIKFLYD
jgi:hypothetical protein